MNLYEINQEILNAINNLEVDENGEILSTSKLDELQEMFETKCENIACYIKNIKADIDALKAEEKKLQERRRVLEHKADRLKDYLSTAMQNTGNTNITTARAAMSFRKSNVIEVDNGFVGWAMVKNKKLLTFKTPEPNKKEIKKLIESGEDVPYAAIVEHQNLQIK